MDRVAVPESTFKTPEQVQAEARLWAQENADTVDTARRALEDYIQNGFCSALPFNWFALFVTTIMGEPDRKGNAALVLAVLKEVQNESQRA